MCWLRSPRCTRPTGGRDGVVPPEAARVLGDFAAYGTRPQVRDRLKCWDDAVDIVMVGCAPGMSSYSSNARWPGLVCGTKVSSMPLAQVKGCISDLPARWSRCQR